jgi:hypothetical protein
MLADRNGKLDNFARTARAGEDHKMQLRNTSGFSNQRLNVKRAAKKPAAQAISVVAKPACARIGGNAARRTVANRAAVSPKSCRPHNHTSATAKRKNGRIPNPANVRLREYELSKSRSLPCHTALDKLRFRRQVPAR